MNKLSPSSDDSPVLDEGEVKPARENGLIGSLQNGLEVFDMFSAERAVVTVGEISRHLGLHKSSASRIASTLVSLGYLRPALSGSGFQLGGKFARLGSLAAANTSLTMVAEPIMRELAELTGETSHLGALDGADAVTFGLVDGSFTLRLHSWVGKRSPAHLTSMGKVLLAGLTDRALDRLYPSEDLVAPTPYSISTKSALKGILSKIKSTGYAIDNEELELGLRCVAAPIYGHDNRVIASLTVAGSSARIQLTNIASYAEKVVAAADAISRELGASMQSLRPQSKAGASA